VRYFALIWLYEEVTWQHESFLRKVKKELPGLGRAPFDTELGQKITKTSRKKLAQWTEFCK